VAAVDKFVRFEVAAPNGHPPHSAFTGQTPDEVYFGTGGKIPEEFEAAEKTARAERSAVNRASSCTRGDPGLN